MYTKKFTSMEKSIEDDRRIVKPSSSLIVIIPTILVIIVLWVKNITILDYTHVLLGGTWTGIDLFMGLVISRVMIKMSVGARIEFIRRLVPMMLFFMPTIASLAITAGIYLATYEGIFSLRYPVIILAGIIVLILVIQGFAIFLPNELRIYFELRKSQPDSKKISRLALINFRLSGVQAAFQFAIIFIMANIATGNLFLKF
ncbi:MAG: hypothetical protein AMDU3_IPLC00004G0363 [Thermoplasmatales archaeon I-plasma]|jgi:hypothetical protein|nr:MAG: hypothetical protein AMDU3_IPLC00004G0363 [Thermoplasmatales archaeon I-plasma]MCL5930276.1 hypothetical protein [Candidatus Thermoplasmatota archaeon]